MKQKPDASPPTNSDGEDIPLKEQLEHLKMILSNTTDAILTFDKNLTITFWNKGAEKLYGFTSKEALGAKPDHLFRAETTDLRIRELLSEINEKGELIFETVHFTRGNRRLDIESHVISNVGQKDEITGYIAVNRNITERKKAEKALKKSEARFRKTFEDSVVGIEHILPSGDWLRVNSKLCEILGYTKEELLSLNYMKITPPEDRIKENELKQKLLAGEIEGFSIEKRYFRKDGTIVWAQLSSSLMEEPEDNLIYIVSVVEDISLRKKTEESLKQSEERFRIAQEHSPDGFTLLRPYLDKDGHLVDFIFEYENSAVAKMNGTEPEKVIGKRLLELFPGHEDTQFFKTYKKVYETGVTIEFEDHYKGETILEDKWFRIVTVPTTGGIAILAQDLTDKKIAEIERIDSEEKLLEAQGLAHMCSFTFDFERKTTSWTKEFLNIFELDNPDEYPTIEKLMELIHPDDRNFVLESVRHAIENKMESLQMDYRIVTGRGNVKYMHYRGKLSYDEQGQHTKRFGTIMDVTERTLKELELRETLENLERSNKDLEQFAYASSHDLQEPLRMVSTYSTLLERKLKGTLDDRTNKYLEILIESSRRMHSLIIGLLEYSRIPSDKGIFIPVDMNEIVNHVLEDLSSSINETKAEIKVEVLPKAKANPAQMKSLMQNLISNAIKFVKDEKPCIEIRAEKTGKYVTFSVKDNGIGISPEDYGRIFEIFQRLHTREVYPGTGIGLSICKRIVEHHGGRIWIESALGKGCKFCVTIPA